MRLWQSPDGTLMRTLEDEPEVEWEAKSAESVAFSPDGRILASVVTTASARVRLWQVSDGALLHDLDAYARRLVFSPDGEVLAAVNNSSAALFSVEDGSLIRRLPEQGILGFFAFSPDGKTLAVGSYLPGDREQQTVRLWRVPDAAPLCTLSHHARHIAFSPDGQILISGSDDHAVRIWRVADGALLHTLQRHWRGGDSVAFSPDGRTLASCTAFGEACYVWRLPEALLKQVE